MRQLELQLITLYLPCQVNKICKIYIIETAIGLFPDVGATYFLPRVFNNETSVGLYMGLIGEKIKGVDLAKCGIATHFVPQQKIETLKKALIDNTNEDINLSKLLNIVKEFSDVTYNPNEFYFPKLDEIKKIFQLDSLDDVFKRLNILKENGSEDEKNWANGVLKTLNKSSPISLLVAFEQIKRGSKIKSMEEAYNLEAQLAAA
jgi:enoyl-CoA hydratase/carnithine racemase